MINIRFRCRIGIVTSSLALLAVLAAGCGGAKKGQLPTAPVTGQVTYRGAPLARGEIKLIPVQTSGKGVRVASGTLDSQGRYCLSTYWQGDGAILGDHRVVVKSRQELPLEAARRASMLGRAAQQPKSLIPVRYADPNTSGLTARVGPGSNTISFELKD